MKPVIIQCICCGRFKRFGFFIDAPTALNEAIINNQVEVRPDTCGNCWDDLK